MNKGGGVSMKGFGSKKSAARFLARQVVLDQVFGEKFEDMEGSGTQWEYSYWHRDTPHDAQKRVEIWARHFPLENHPPIEHCRFLGTVMNCTYDCESIGYSKCDVRKRLEELTEEFMNGRVYDPRTPSQTTGEK
jgi:hypothetical protein